MVTKTTKKKAAPKAKAPKVKAQKIEKEVTKEKKETFFEGEYFYAVGKRKTAVAQVRIYPDKKGKGKSLVNGKEFDVYFSLKRTADLALSPLTVCGQVGNFDVSVKVNGGGSNAQSEAVRLGISRALLISDEGFKKILRAQGFLTRDSRKVERKKPGKKKARRSPQWAKR